MTTHRPPKDAHEGRAHYEAALRVLKHKREENARRLGDDPELYAPILQSEVAALHALTIVDPDGYRVGPDFELVAEVANLVRNGYDLVDGELVRVRKTREADGGPEKFSVT